MLRPTGWRSINVDRCKKLPVELGSARKVILLCSESAGITEKHIKFGDASTVFRDDVALFDPKEKPLRRAFFKDL
jgi:hypothetical protein